jgi:hypothetical protein
MANIALITNNILSDSGTAITSVLSGSGTTNYLPKFTGSTAIGNSIISESSGLINVAGRISASGLDYSTIAVQSGSAQLKLERTSTSAGYMYIGADDSGFKVFNSSFTPHFIVASTGNVGIGTTNPTEKLYVAGNQILDDGTNGRLTFALASGENNIYSTTTGFGSYKTLRFTSSEYIYRIGGSEVMRIASSGNVLIGTTTDNSAKLQVNGFSYFGSDMFTYNNGGIFFSGMSSYGSGIFQNPSNSLILRAGSVDRLCITSGGNVGIGTNNPYGDLEVTSQTRPWGEGIVVNPSSSGYEAIFFRVEGTLGSSYTGTWAIGKNAGSDPGGEVFQVVKNGLTGGALYRADASQQWKANGDSIFGFNVGIGTSTPYTILELKSTDPVQRFSVTGGVANNKTYEIRAIGASGYEGLQFRAVNDANTVYDSLMFLSRNGNVGIGATNPAAKLEVRGSTAQLLISQDATHQMYFGVDNSYAEIQAIRSGVAFDKSLILQRQGGNVLIGITTDNGAKLQVNGDAYFGSFINSTFRYSFVGFGTYNSYHTYIVNTNSSNGTYGLGVNNYNTSSDGYILGLSSAGVERMIVRNDGNVGIGTSSPYGKLSLEADGTVNNYSSVIRVANTGSGKWGGISFVDSQTSTTNANNYYFIGRGASFSDRVLSFHIPTASDYGSGSQPKIGFYSTGADPLFTVEASTGTTYFKGNVLIGTTTNSGYKLDVVGGTARIVYSGYAGIEYHNTAGTWEGYIGTESGSGNLRYNSRQGAHTWYYNSTATMTLTSGGNLGVGTTSPAYKLQVAGDIGFTSAANRYLTMQSPSTSGSGGNMIIQSASANTSGTGGNLYLYVGGGAGGPGPGKIYIGNNNGWDVAYVTGILTVSSTGPNTGDVLRVSGGGRNALTIAWDNLTPFMSYSLVSGRQSRFLNSSSYYFDNNFLIGTTTDGGYKLSVNGNGNFILGNSGYIRLQSGSGQRHGYIQSAFSNFLFSNNIYYDGSNWRYDQNGYGAQIQTETLSVGVIAFNTFASGTAGNVATIIESMRIVNNGNILMGTTTDSGYKLDVNGTSRFTNSISLTGSNRYIASGSSSQSIYITGGTSYLDGAYFNLTGNTYGASPGAGSAEFVIRTNSDSKFALFGYNGSSWSSYMTLFGPTGNLNIGSGTTDSGYKLRIEGNTYNDGEIISVGNITTNGSAYVNANAQGYNLIVYPNTTSGPNNLYSGGQVQANIYTSSNGNAVTVVPSTSQVVMAWYPSTTQGVFIDYTLWIYGGANAMRSGTFMVVNDSSGNVQYTDIATPDLNASTALATLAAANNGGVMEVTLTNGSGNVVFINTVTRYIPTMV